jgi:hypothetical protein
VLVSFGSPRYSFFAEISPKRRMRTSVDAIPSRGSTIMGVFTTVQRASEVTRMHYDVVVKTPIIVLPRDGIASTDVHRISPSFARISRQTRKDRGSASA